MGASDPVTDFPSMSARPPSLLVRLISALPLCRLWVEAPTEMSQGASAGEPVVAKPGPSLPLDVATMMLAARAFRNPMVSKSLHRADGALDPIE